MRLDFKNAKIIYVQPGMNIGLHMHAMHKAQNTPVSLVSESSPDTAKTANVPTQKLPSQLAAVCPVIAGYQFFFYPDGKTDQVKEPHVEDYWDYMCCFSEDEPLLINSPPIPYIEIQTKIDNEMRYGRLSHSAGCISGLYGSPSPYSDSLLKTTIIYPSLTHWSDLKSFREDFPPGTKKIMELKQAPRSEFGKRLEEVMKDREIIDLCCGHVHASFQVRLLAQLFQAKNYLGVDINAPNESIKDEFHLGDRFQSIFFNSDIDDFLNPIRPVKQGRVFFFLGVDCHDPIKIEPLRKKLLDAIGENDYLVVSTDYDKKQWKFSNHGLTKIAEDDSKPDYKKYAIYKKSA